MKLVVAGAFLLLMIPVTVCVERPKPLLLIFTPGQPGFGDVLAEMIGNDGRIDGNILVLHSEDLFEVMIRFPHVKLAVVSIAQEILIESSKSMLWFFDDGGGLVGLGYAGSSGSTGRASESVFPLFGNDYKSGKYDPQRKRFSQTFVRDEDHQISAGIGNFEAPAQRLILSTNLTTGNYLEKKPVGGEITVLYRDSVNSAPVLVAYRGNGTSVTFATYGGEDFERSFAYHGLFAKTDEFTTLFTNAVYWVWEGESRYESSYQMAIDYYSDLRSIEMEMREEAENLIQASRNSRAMRSIFTIALALIASAALYWLLLVRSKGEIKD